MFYSHSSLVLMFIALDTSELSHHGWRAEPLLFFFFFSFFSLFFLFFFLSFFLSFFFSFFLYLSLKTKASE